MHIGKKSVVKKGGCGKKRGGCGEKVENSVEKVKNSGYTSWLARTDSGNSCQEDTT
jgi:hypothetical protein